MEKMKREDAMDTDGMDCKEKTDCIGSKDDQATAAGTDWTGAWQPMGSWDVLGPMATKRCIGQRNHGECIKWNE